MEENNSENKESEKNNKAIEEKKDKVRVWLKDPSNLIILAILIFSAVVLLYYFGLTKNQTLWWDEAEYMSIAKHWAFAVPYDINPARPPLFPFMALILYKLGLNEIGLRILLVLFPMWLSVLFFYIFIKELYDKKTALIASFILSVSWIHLFYSMRLMTDMAGFLFGILAFYCFWKGHIQKKSKYLVWLVGVFIALSFLLRLTGVFYAAIIVLFLFLTENFKFLKDKNLWMIPVTFFLTISPYLLWAYMKFGNPLAFRAGYSGPEGTQLGWWMFQLFRDYPELGFFILFLVGLITLVPMFLSFDQLILGKDKKHQADLFMLLTIIFTFGFFFYFVRTGENRWLILMSVGIFAIAAKGILLIYDFAEKNLGKSFAIVVLIIILITGAYFQLNHADSIIKSKIDSYSQVKDAALWMKENSQKSDIIATASITQTVYYSERKVISFYNFSGNTYYTPEQFEDTIKFNKPKYFVSSIFEPSIPEWTYSFANGKENKYIPVKVWFADQQQTQPIQVIYQVNYSAF